MKVKVSEAERDALDWMVTKLEAERKRFTIYPEYITGYSTDWAHGGPIIERESISTENTTMRGEEGRFAWRATRIEGSSVSEEYGPTPLVAAMRCYVKSQLGDEVDVPEELK